MKVDLFDFELPPEFIADRPASPRDSSRMLHVQESGCDDHIFRELPDLLRPDDVLVLNNTKVLPARIRGFRDAVPIEMTLAKMEAPTRWWVLAKPGKRLKPGHRVVFAEDLSCDVLEKNEAGHILVSFEGDDATFFEALDRCGEMPLPPYIGRQKGADNQDDSDYQTLFAKEKGAVAAPTAGLHFTPAVMEALAEKGIVSEQVTLHVGAGTFLPVKVEDTNAHIMHAEYGIISEKVAARLTRYKEEGRRLVAVGTTAMRLLESAADERGVIHSFAQETDIFITPGYRFRAIDVLLTNFHLPRSTLFMLVCAFSGLERMQAAYAHAKETGYRFYSYGDACLLEKKG